MNHMKAAFATVVFVLAMLAAVQNVEVLSQTLSLGLHWPETMAFAMDIPLYVVIVVIFLLGFGLVSLFALREHFTRQKDARAIHGRIKALELQLVPAPALASFPEANLVLSPASIRDDQDGQQTQKELTMDSTDATATVTEAPRALSRDEEILVPPSAPGWGAVMLLAAGLALVISGGVYIVLNDRISQFSSHLDQVSGLTGHLHSAQEELHRTWEQERVVVREDIDALGKSHAALLAEMGTLEQQVQALSRLPEEVRKRLMAGFLRDTAGRAAFLGTQVEDDEQRHTLDGISQRLQNLALELEGGGEPEHGSGEPTPEP